MTPWRCWTLSTWFKDYLYIPLGGNRGSKGRTYANLFSTFVISGLWHGANWTFVIWGAIHGAFQIVERVAQELKFPDSRPLNILVVFAGVCLAWVFFRAAAVAGCIFRSLAVCSANLHGSPYMGDIGIFAFSVTGVLVLLLIEFFQDAPDTTLLNHRWAPVRYATMLTMLVWIITLGVFDGSQFIYFQF